MTLWRNTVDDERYTLKEVKKQSQAKSCRTTALGVVESRGLHKKTKENLYKCFPFPEVSGGGGGDRQSGAGLNKGRIDSRFPFWSSVRGSQCPSYASKERRICYIQFFNRVPEAIGASHPTEADQLALCQWVVTLQYPEEREDRGIRAGCDDSGKHLSSIKARAVRGVCGRLWRGCRWKGRTCASKVDRNTNCTTVQEATILTGK